MEFECGLAEGAGIADRVELDGNGPGGGERCWAGGSGGRDEGAPGCGKGISYGICTQGAIGSEDWTGQVAGLGPRD